MLGPNGANIDLEFEEDLALAEDFKEAVMIVNDKKPFTVGMENSTYMLSGWRDPGGWR